MPGPGTVDEDGTTRPALLAHWGLRVMAFLVDLGIPSIWAFAQDVGGRHVGAALGWGNMWGNLGAAASPVALQIIRDQAGCGNQKNEANPSRSSLRATLDATPRTSRDDHATLGPQPRGGSTVPMPLT